MIYSKNLRDYIDLKLVLLLAGFYTIFDIIHFFKASYGRYLNNYQVDSWFNLIVGDYLLDWAIVVGFMLIIAVSTKRLIQKKFSWKKIILFHFILSLFIGILIRFFSDLYMVIVRNIAFDLKYSIGRIIYVMDLNFLIYFAMVSMIYGFYYMRELKETERDKAILQTKLVDTKMKMLTSQLQPHFLFNTLNCISSLIAFDPKKAQNTLVDLSQFFREILDNSDSHFIQLAKELEILDHYLNILNVRFSDDLAIYKFIDEDLLERVVPALIIQPLIENSVIHGYSYEEYNLVIKIKVYSENGFLYIIVENNGAPIKLSDNSLKKGRGLRNIEERLNHIYKSNYLFEIKNLEFGKGVRNIIKIPLISSNASSYRNFLTPSPEISS